MKPSDYVCCVSTAISFAIGLKFGLTGASLLLALFLAVGSIALGDYLDARNRDA